MEENAVSGALMYFLLLQCYNDDQIKKDERGWSYGTNGRERKHLLGFVRKT
jgi:hypothetical protein